MNPTDAKYLAAAQFLSDVRELAASLPPDLTVLCIVADPARPGEIWVGGNMSGETVCAMLPALHRQHLLEHHTTDSAHHAKELS